MRKVLLIVSVLLVAGVQAARADVILNAAPADEYFGPSQQSVLEIRNRLDDFDRHDASRMLDPSVPAYLDHLQLAIRDWQTKYPRDPWLPQVLAHLVREYWRAGQSSGEQATAALADLRSSYPDSAITASTVALIYGSNPELTTVADDSAGGPPPAYAPSESPYVTSPVAPYAVADAQAPPAEVPSVYEAPPPEQERLAEEAPPAEVALPAIDTSPPSQLASASGYDAARGYDTVRGYDAARGYDVARGYHVTPGYDAARGYDAWRGYDASRGISTAANIGAQPAVPVAATDQSPPR